MKDIKNENKKEQTTGINPVAAAVTGAIIGAGAVVAGAIVLSDKENQKKVKKAVSDAKEKMREYKAGIEEKSQALKEDAQDKAEQVGGKVEKLIAVAKEPLEEAK